MRGRRGCRQRRSPARSARRGTASSSCRAAQAARESAATATSLRAAAPHPARAGPPALHTCAGSPPRKNRPSAMPGHIGIHQEIHRPRRLIVRLRCVQDEPVVRCPRQRQTDMERPVAVAVGVDRIGEAMRADGECLAQPPPHQFARAGEQLGERVGHHVRAEALQDLLRRAARQDRPMPSARACRRGSAPG